MLWGEKCESIHQLFKKAGIFPLIRFQLQSPGREVLVLAWKTVSANILKPGLN